MTGTAERVDTWEMNVIHRLFKREFRRAPDLIRGVADGDAARAEVVGDYFADIATGLHHHHSGEDDLLWPLLLERATLHADLIHRMESQHERLGVQLHRIDELLPRWRAKAEASVRDELADVIAQASVVLEEHLTEEENEILPIVSEHLTQHEWEALGKRGQEAIPKKGAKPLIALGAILEEASPKERELFLAQLPAPVRVIYKVVGAGMYRRAMTRLVGPAR